MSATLNIGCCGLYCGSCPIYLSRYYPAMRKKIAEQMHCKEHEVKCNGCNNLSKDCWGQHCKIRSCICHQDLEYCNQCPDYPCAHWKRLSVGHWDIPERQLREVAEMGDQEIRRILRKRWTCSCGQPLVRTDNTCASCGADNPHILG